MTVLNLDYSQRQFAFTKWYAKARLESVVDPTLFTVQLGLRLAFRPITKALSITEAAIARFIMAINFTLMAAFWTVTIALIVTHNIGPGIPALFVLGLPQMIVLTVYQYRQLKDFPQSRKKRRPPRMKQLMIFYCIMTTMNAIAIAVIVLAHTPWSSIDSWCVIISAMICCLVLGVLELNGIASGDKWRITFATPRVVTQVTIAVVSLCVGVASPWALSAFFLAFALTRLVGNRQQYKQQQTTPGLRMVQIEKCNLLTATLLLTEGVGFAL